MSDSRFEIVSGMVADALEEAIASGVPDSALEAKVAEMTGCDPKDHFYQDVFSFAFANAKRVQ